jgi:hypothetical protein
MADEKEQTQITDDALKGGFKADGHKARFDLFPEAILRTMLDKVFGTANLSTELRDLCEMMLTFWHTPLDVDAARQTLWGIIYKASDVYCSDVSIRTDRGLVPGDDYRAATLLDFMFAVGELFALGASKYKPRNWELGMDYARVWSAMFRHLLKFSRGERNDEVDGQHHMTSIAWCAIVLLHFEQNRDTYRSFDSRGQVERAEDKGQA